VEVYQFANALTTKWKMSRQAAFKMDTLAQAVEERTRQLAGANIIVQSSPVILNRLRGEPSFRSFTCLTTSPSWGTIRRRCWPPATGRRTCLLKDSGDHDFHGEFGPSRRKGPENSNKVESPTSGVAIRLLGTLGLAGGSPTGACSRGSSGDGSGSAGEGIPGCGGSGEGISST
jgi:hypothetical protein